MWYFNEGRVYKPAEPWEYEHIVQVSYELQ